MRENIRRTARLLREAAKELENEASRRKVVLSRKTGEFDSDIEDLDIQNEKTEAFLEEFKRIYNQSFGDVKEVKKYYDYDSGRFYISISTDPDCEIPDDIDSETENAIYEEIDMTLSWYIEELIKNIEQTLGYSIKIMEDTPMSFTLVINAYEIVSIYEVIEVLDELKDEGELTATNIMDTLQMWPKLFVGHKENWYEELIKQLKSYCARAEEDYRKVFDLIHDFESLLSDREYWQEIVDSVIKNIKSE